MFPEHVDVLRFVVLLDDQSKHKDIQSYPVQRLKQQILYMFRKLKVFSDQFGRSLQTQLLR